jgi:hypothetical protein
MGRYGLARHVFVCRDEEYIVVLDLRQDRYFALEAAKTAALGAVLPGWPVPRPQADAHAGSRTAEEVAAPLLSKGWLLEESAASKEATPVAAPTPQTELIRRADVVSSPTLAGSRLGMRSVIAFIVASVLAKFVLRFWRFERVIRRVAERKVRRADPSRPLDLARARELIDAFERMRVFLFSSREECLHDSLAVLEFLAWHGVFPSWVFGVRARPFVAHCWVQHAGTVFNDTVEHVTTYVPIMLV